MPSATQMPASVRLRKLRVSYLTARKILGVEIIRVLRGRGK
jgi:hypothetical protein